MPLALVKIPARLGYLALIALVGGESLGLPLPGETALIAAGLLARRGELHIELVIVLAAAAAIVGDNLGYLIGRRAGRRLLGGAGPLARYRRGLLVRAEPFFARHGAKAVFLGRWVTVLRVTAAWMAGVAGMPWRSFLLWNALGGAAWAASVGLAAFVLGSLAERIAKDIGLGGAIALAVVAAVLLLWWWLRTLMRLLGAPAEPPPARRHTD